MSRRLVAGLVALVAFGGVFAYGLSKQDDVSELDTQACHGAPGGLQDRSPAAAIAGSTLDGKRFSLASCAASPSSSTSGALVPGLQGEAPHLRAFANGLGSQAAWWASRSTRRTTDTRGSCARSAGATRS